MTRTRVHAVANQKGGVGKTTLAMNLAATTEEVLTSADRVRALAGGPPEPARPSPVLVVSTDPQASSVWWSDRVADAGVGLPFDYAQVSDPRELRGLRSSGKAHVFADTPGSLEDEAMLQAVLDECDDVIVPMLTEPLCFDPTRRTIEDVIIPRGLPFIVVVNNWETRDGQSDLRETAQYIAAKGWPMCGTVIRRYKVHTRAAAEGRVVTQYQRNRVAMEARDDFLRLALELGYGGQPTARAEG